MTAIDEQHEAGAQPRYRPMATAGWKSWLTTVDHKKIGIMYFVTAMAFFVIGGLEAVAIRIQLAGPEGTFLTADQYNQVFTMHGLTMIFLGVMPLSAAFFNYLLPLQIGARDVAFPRINALSYWVFLFGGLFLISSVLFGGAPDGAWTGYAPLNTIGADPGALNYAETVHDSRMLFYSLGLQIVGVASLASSVNFIVTIFNMRAPGMTFMRMPVFTWMTLVVSFLMLFALPVIGVALWQLMFDVGYGSNFFRAEAGADPILWQHLFWLFGHPEVYILILPAFGIISEILPVFSRKPLFGYTAIVFSGIAIGFMGWGVWAHHMFASGLGPVANTAFGLSTMFIAVPTGIKIFNWIGTMWGGQLRFTTAMLFSIGLVSMFVIGGLSGVTHAMVPHNTQQHDTYYIVAHFHYVLFGGAIFGLFAGVYYWFPLVTGRLMNELLGKAHFFLLLIGFNLTFGPHHILGLNGMPRRIYTYPEGFGWDQWNLVSTIGAFTIALGVLVFIINIALSAKKGTPAGLDPWDARTIEWTIQGPPPPHNYDVLPTVTARDELWHRKYAGGDEHSTPKRVPAGASSDHVPGATPAGQQGDGASAVGEQGATAAGGGGLPPEADPSVKTAGGGHGIHMPDPSFWPLVVAAGMPVAGYGVIFDSWLVIGTGGLVLLVGMLGWALEPGAEPTPDHP